ncbi:E3 ubiquitin-protein ligase TRIM39-like [Mantella aurantiaca]
MAFTDLRAELECSICLNIYTDPVMLRCGHNFCRVCFDRVLDTQEGSGGYSCPECREKFQERPVPKRNMKLRNIVENFLSARPHQETGVFCTYCIHAPVPAVKSCLLCEASMCDNHLRVHSRSREHVLCDPTATPQNRKCSIHKELFKYYCMEDSTCICVSCCLIGEHKGHEMESLDEASEQKKKKLRNDLQKMITKRMEMGERVQSLQEQRSKVEEQADGESKRVTALFREIRRRLDDLEKRILSEITGQAKRNLLSLNDLIHQLEIKKDELSRKMHQIEEMCNMTDPLTVLQESDSGDLCDTEDGDNDDRKRHDKLLHDSGSLDVFRISHILHVELSDIRTWVNKGIYIPEPADILLDVNTAGNNLQISDGKKAAFLSPNQNYPVTSERFQDCPQVISSQRFSLGRHYWDLNVGRSKGWRVGVCYPSIERKGDQSIVGNNNKSWVITLKPSGLFGLIRMFAIEHDMQSVIGLAKHDSEIIQLRDNISSGRIRIYLEYEAGRISFYDLCHPIRHLHTFTATFTEPLHVALSVNHGCVNILE